MAEDSAKPDDIEELMKMLGVEPSKPAPRSGGGPSTETQEIRVAAETEGLHESDAEIAVAPDPEPLTPPPTRANLEPLISDFDPIPMVAPPPPPMPASASGLGLLGDVDVQLRIELGRARLYVQDVLALGPGSVVPLESLAGDPLDIYVNDQLVARGEAVVVDESFAVRITEVVVPPRSGTS